MNANPTPANLPSIYVPTEADLAETRALQATTISGRALLAKQGFSAIEIDAMAAQHREPGALSPRPTAPAPAAATAMARPVPTIAAVPPPPGDRTYPPTPDGWKAEWAASADLQATFGTFERFANYQAGVAAGRVRIITGGNGRIGPQVARSFVASPARQPVKG